VLSTQPAGGVLPTPRARASATAAMTGTAGSRCIRSAMAPATPWSYDAMTVDADVLGARGEPEVASGCRCAILARGAAVRWFRYTRPARTQRLERPVKWLAGFAAVDADPAETVSAEISVPSAFSSTGPTRAGRSKPGTFVPRPAPRRHPSRWPAASSSLAGRRGPERSGRRRRSADPGYRLGSRRLAPVHQHPDVGARALMVRLGATIVRSPTRSAVPSARSDAVTTGLRRCLRARRSALRVRHAGRRCTAR